jgi:hypothetical protein
MRRTQLLLLMMAVVGPVHAQNDELQTVYAGLQDSVRADYQSLRAQLSRAAIAMALNAAKEREELKMLSYNKAVLFASCVVESERDRSPAAMRRDQVCGDGEVRQPSGLRSSVFP